MKEIWKDISGYEGLYQVSNLGRVRSFIQRGGRNMRNNPLYLSSLSNSSGYKQVSLGVKRVLIHRLVAIGFVPNPENKSQVNHINGDKLDNRAKNLEWVTPKENVYHSMNVLSNKNGGKMRARRVMCVETGKIYDSILSASRHTNIASPNIFAVASAGRNGKYNGATHTTAGGFHWCFV